MTPPDAIQVLRGGSWGYYPWYFCRSAYRIHSVPGAANEFVGFRAVCLPQEVSPPRMPLRGGSWDNGRLACRSACRDDGGPGYHDELMGFRVVCLHPAPQDFTWLP